MHLRIRQEQPSGEFCARVFHVLVGFAFIGVALWVLFDVTPFNPYAFFGLLIFGAMPLLIGLLGDRKTVLQTLLLGWV